MATLLNAVTSDTDGTPVELTGPCTVWVHNNLGGGEVVILGRTGELSFVKLDNVSSIKSSRLQQPGCLTVDIQGTYEIKAVLANTKVAAFCTVVAEQ